MPAQKSIKDNLYAVRYFVSGQGLSLAVFKATRNDLIGPKTKHVDYLTTITHQPNVSIPKIIKYLSERAHHFEWAIVFKTLIVVHHILNRGSVSFIQSLASSSGNDRPFSKMNSFNDVTSKLSLDMSIYLRRYSRYLDSRIKSYRTLGVDFCRLKTHGSKLPVDWKNLQHDKLMATIPSLQKQFDSVLRFDITMAGLDNGVIDQAFLMLYGDLVKLYIVYQAAMIRVIELFMSTRYLDEARQYYDVYSRFLIRMDMVRDFMSVVDSTGIKTDDFPRVSRVPDIKLDAFKEKLQELEGKTSSQLSASALKYFGLPVKQEQDKYGHINVSGGQAVSKITIKKLSKSKPSSQQQLTISCSRISSGLSTNSDNKTRNCDKQIRLSESSFRRKIGTRNTISLHEGTTPGIFRDGKRVVQPVKRIDGIQFDKYIISAKLAECKRSDTSATKHEHEHKREQQRFDLLGHSSKTLGLDVPQTSGLDDYIQPSAKSIEDLFSSKQSDFDLMVVDSEISSTSSDTSHLNDASPYFQLEEKELIEQVFPKELDKITIMTGIDKQNELNPASCSPPLNNDASMDNNNKLTNVQKNHDNHSQKTTSSSDWVHVDVFSDSTIGMRDV